MYLCASHFASHCVCMCVHAEGVGQGLCAGFSLASSSSPAVSNELGSTALSLPLSWEITLWSSSSPSPASLLTCAHSLINTFGSLGRSGWLRDSTSMSFSLLFSPSLVLNLDFQSVGLHREKYNLTNTEFTEVFSIVQQQRSV